LHTFIRMYTFNYKPIITNYRDIFERTNIKFYNLFSCIRHKKSKLVLRLKSLMFTEKTYGTTIVMWKIRNRFIEYIFETIFFQSRLKSTYKLGRIFNKYNALTKRTSIKFMAYGRTCKVLWFD